MPKLYGVSPSPFVRKTMVVLAEKGLDYESVPVSPFALPEAYKEKSPLGKIPCWEDGDFILPDSSAIAAYLEREHPEPALYPKGNKAYGRALFLEEYADTALAQALLIPFFERLVKPRYLNQEADEARVEKALTELMPPVLDHLEGLLGDQDWFLGAFSIADIAIASPFVNFRYGKGEFDAARWPKLTAWLGRALARDSFKSCLAADARMLAGGK